MAVSSLILCSNLKIRKRKYGRQRKVKNNQRKEEIYLSGFLTSTLFHLGEKGGIQEDKNIRYDLFLLLQVTVTRTFYKNLGASCSLYLLFSIYYKRRKIYVNVFIFGERLINEKRKTTKTRHEHWSVLLLLSVANVGFHTSFDRRRS